MERRRMNLPTGPDTLCFDKDEFMKVRGHPAGVPPRRPNAAVPGGSGGSQGRGWMVGVSTLNFTLTLRSGSLTASPPCSPALTLLTNPSKNTSLLAFQRAAHRL